MRKLFPIVLLAAAAAIVYVVKKTRDNKMHVPTELKESKTESETPAESHIEHKDAVDETLPPLKTDEKTEETDENMRLLNLQVDLVMANYVDDKIFLVQHHILYDNDDKLLALVRELKLKDYIIVDSDEGLVVEKVILQTRQEVKDDILIIAKRVRDDKAVYKGFNVIPQ